MPNSLTYLGHSAFILQTEKNLTIWFDPWLQNPKAPASFDKQGVKHIILVSHAHGDHLGDTINIAKETNATIVSIHEIYRYLNKKGLQNLVGMNIGGSVVIDDIKITMVPAIHSSSIEENNEIIYGGEPCGFVVKLPDGKTLYHAGDTALFGDMSLISRLYKPQIVMLPIGGHYVMGPEEAAIATMFLKPELVIPMHYGTFPLLKGTPAEYENELKKNGITQDKVYVAPLTPGETMDF
jgi:L-ascorbate metabolism protein UlaG (beta-lactamase superfamily)